MSGWPAPPYLLPNLDTVDGETELAPGLRLVRAPGHTPGSQAVIVDTDLGSFCIAGDAISTYANIEQDIPPGFHVNVDDSVDSMDRLRATADHFLPSHDYAVFTGGRHHPHRRTLTRRDRGSCPSPDRPLGPGADDRTAPRDARGAPADRRMRPSWPWWRCRRREPGPGQARIAVTAPGCAAPTSTSSMATTPAGRR